MQRSTERFETLGDRRYQGESCLPDFGLWETAFLATRFRGAFLACFLGLSIVLLGFWESFSIFIGAGLGDDLISFSSSFSLVWPEEVALWSFLFRFLSCREGRLPCL